MKKEGHNRFRVRPPQFFSAIPVISSFFPIFGKRSVYVSRSWCSFVAELLLVGYNMNGVWEGGISQSAFRCVREGSPLNPSFAFKSMILRKLEIHIVKYDINCV